MTRRLTGGLAIGFLLALAAFDVATARLNPFVAPPMLALGSGQAVTSAHCAALPD